ncbi:MAG TPA: uroporphyrinogen-III C-methyltransferase [Candidatus Faecivivens stercoravium]|uniref:uroporphyrinogen-III C-methyltransferase n=1 Tax=Candidatus Faecivivens stercoravium TaxID=2840803 RepID=A0A9D1DYF1_9FIRM|nr:uroporphyrinogen-III C-methyltransferase [Candidatus Faecivivens stercoravium]
MSGKIILVGAGPGGKGLLTLRGLEALGEADAVVYDRLVSEEILSLIPSSAEKIDAGKSPGSHPVPQPEINRILVEKAEEGKTVVRLKGGDPFVFGRGGEELDIPAEKGIPFEVVPGVTSAVAALSEAGIPVTARGVASSFHVITGHQKGDEPLQIPFDALAKAGGTLVFLMGMGALPRLSEGLLSAGMDPETPAAIVENGARPEQRKLLSTLARLPEEAAAMGLHSPAVIAVGAVCGLSGRYGWREKLPLHGKKIIAGRSGSAEGKLLRLLERMGASVYDLPLIRTDPLPGPLPPELLDSRWLTFSSKVGVRCFFARLVESGLDTRALSGVKIAAVGRATAAALREKGILPDLIPEQFDGEHLGKALIERTDPFDLITLCEPESPSGTLREMLTAAGRTVRSLPLYRTAPLPLREPERVERMLREGVPAAFSSGSMARSLAASLPGMDFSGVTAFCIGRETGKAAREAGFRTVVAEEATLEGLAGKIRETLAAKGS